MTTNIASAVEDRFSSLGIGVDNLDMNEAVDRVVDLVSASRDDGRARLVATLNVDFIVNALGYFFSSPSHPELLGILRSADLVTADGFPVVMLSRIMGSAIKGRVAGADLVPALATRAANENLSLFLLGGSNGSAELAADKLVADNPGLQIAGIMSPMIHVSGDGLLDYEQDDAAIVSRINNSGADILLIGLGNPKQEQWFYRNRHKLKVPVSIGVGGTFEFIAGRVKRAPESIQRLNLEWVYRIFQDPGRLWKRYVKGLFKFGLLSLPIVLIRLRELLHWRKPAEAESLTTNTLWGSRDDVIRTVQLPGYVTRELLNRLNRQLQEQQDNSLLIIDLSRVRHIELAAHMAFYELGDLFRTGSVSGMLLGLRASVRRRLQAGRIMDACQRHLVDMDTFDLSPKSRESRSEVGCRSYVLSDSALIYLTGHLNGEAISNLGLDICIADMSRDRTCIIDLRYADAVESTAISRLYNMVRSLPEAAHHIHFSGVSKQVQTLFRLAGYERHISFINESELHRFLFSSKEV